MSQSIHDDYTLMIALRVAADCYRYDQRGIIDVLHGRLPQRRSKLVNIDRFWRTHLVMEAFKGARAHDKLIYSDYETSENDKDEDEDSCD